jgi:CRISPR-associated protein Cas1
MSYHIVSIDSPQCSLSCKDGQLTCTVKDEPPRRLPLEDVAAIIITSFSANIHSHLFLEAAKHGVALIICEDFKPTCLVLPANRSTDTLLSRALLKLEEKTLKRFWQQTIDAKCRNQYSLAAHLAPEDRALPMLRASAWGRKPHKEAICAKLFWQIFGRSQGDPEFTRERGAPGLNSLLNYGYAVLLSTILQKLFGVGLDPTFGISHVARERSTPLAYDLMEPFRPCVDWRVVQWVREHPAEAPWQVTAEFRKWVTGFPLVQVDYLDFTLEVRGCIEGVVRGFRKAVLGGDPKFYRPWTPKNSKWAG